ncbi:MAG: hypothetical protein AB7K09_06990 [Planctomycetota bacterium]
MQFNASVEPINHYLEETVRKACGKKEYRQIKATFDALTLHLKKVFAGKADAVQKILFETAGGLQANHLIDKFGVMRDLRDYAEELTEALVKRGGADPANPPFAHLMNLGDGDGVLLPFRFATPFQLQVKGRVPFPVSSCVNLRDELNIINKHLKVEHTFKLSQLPPLLEATSAQIEQFEKMYDVDPSFWIKFGFTVLRTLNTVALEYRLPVIFHYI